MLLHPGFPDSRKDRAVKKLLPLCLIAAMVPACSDPQAEEKARQIELFDKAVARYRDAQKGYVPKGSEERQPQSKAPVSDLAVYRLKTLDMAAGELSRLTTTGTPGRQVAAARMLAECHAAAARNEARLALSDWTAMTNRSARLLALMVAVDRASSRAGLLRDDSADAVAKLQAQAQDYERAIDQNSTAAQKLEAQISELKGKIAVLQETSTKELNAGRALRQDLMGQGGAVQFEIYQKAAAAERRGNVASSEAQQLSAQVDVFSGEANILRTRVGLDAKSAEAVKGRITELQEQARQTRAARDEALRAKADFEQQLLAERDEIGKVYGDQVENRLYVNSASAKVRAEEAIKVTKEARSKSSSPNDKRWITLDLLAQQTMLAQILADFVTASGSYAQTLEVLDSQAKRLMPNANFGETATLIRGTQSKAAEEAKAVLGEATNLASELATDANGTVLADFVVKYQAELASATTRIDQGLATKASAH